jgi:hypothetical protein
MHLLSPTNSLPNEFDDLAKVTEAVACGSFVSVAASGAPGIGKTHTVMRVLNRHFGRNAGAFEVYSQATTTGLVQKLWERRSGGILVLDDADQLLTGGGETRANLMKKVLENRSVRQIVWDTQRSRDDDGTAPPSFTTKAQVIWLGNSDLDNPVGLSNKMKIHLRALRSRLSYYVRMSSDDSDVLDYVLWLATTNDMLKNNAFKLQEGNDALRWFVEHARYLNEISVRSLLNVAALRRELPNDWEHMAHKSFLQVAARVGLVVPPVPVMTLSSVTPILVTVPAASPAASLSASPLTPTLPEQPESPHPSPAGARAPANPSVPVAAISPATVPATPANLNTRGSVAGKKETPTQQRRRLEYKIRDLNEENRTLREELMTIARLYRQTPQGARYTSPTLQAADISISPVRLNSSVAPDSTTEQARLRAERLTHKLLNRAA